MQVLSVLLVSTVLFCGAAEGKDVVSASLSFDWRHTEPHGNLVSAVRNYQSLPGKECGEIGWSFAATSMVSDRLAILEPLRPKVQLSNQVILNCAADFDGCTSSEGSIETALAFILESGGIPDRTCMSWRGQKEECSADNMCVNCLGTGCENRPQYFRYSIASYGRVDVSDSAAMTKELKNGPLACKGTASAADAYFTLVGFTQPASESIRFIAKFERGTFFQNKGFSDVTQADLLECWFADVHAHERFFVKKPEFEDPLSLKMSGTVQDGFFSLLLNTVGETLGFVEAQRLQFTRERFEGHRSQRQIPHRNTGNPSTLRSESEPEKYIAEGRFLSQKSLPKNFSWNNKNTLTPTQSHHNGAPFGQKTQYCGACWSLAAASAFSDRLKINNGGKYAPDVYVSPQTTIDCVKPNGCQGGGADEAYMFYQSFGTVDETCNAWRTGEHECMSQGTGCRACDKHGNCSSIDSSTYTSYTAEGWANIEAHSEIGIQKALLDGPIVCGIASNPGLNEKFFGESIICDDEKNNHLWEIDHDVEVVGWGETAQGEKFWEIRNSWSTAYGQGGFFKVCRGKNNLLIEESCTWVTPALLK